MVASLTILAFMWWSYWLFGRDRQSPKATTAVVRPGRDSAGDMSSHGLEDDPDRWRATRVAWTPWDEHQLTQLLQVAAPINRSARNPPDNAIPHVEHEETT